MESLGKIYSFNYSLNRRFIKMFLLFNQIRENGRSHSEFRFEISLIVTVKNERSLFNAQVWQKCNCFYYKKNIKINQAGYHRNHSSSCISAIVYQVILILLKSKIWLSPKSMLKTDREDSENTAV